MTHLRRVPAGGYTASDSWFDGEDIAARAAVPHFNPLATVVLQLLSYRGSGSRGQDPGVPSNLSKTLMVDYGL
jgi:glucosamine 6-phosphate synthetase-like amidotransferase/phosphosugar isomerase protein